MCETYQPQDADFIKTSTGFSAAGATKPDVALMKAHMAAERRVKAAGGIADFCDAAEFVRLGADRLGTSRLVEQAKERGRFRCRNIIGSLRSSLIHSEPVQCRILKSLEMWEWTLSDTSREHMEHFNIPNLQKLGSQT